MTTARRKFLVDGIVQGVGFRPFVFNLAVSLKLRGYVTNTSEGVVIEVQGEPGTLACFATRLRDEAPPLAQIVALTAANTDPEPCADFVIRPSVKAPGTNTLIPPDVATCSDCLREIRDPGDRRHGYAFTNCTNCGPRWTIIKRIPYDRPFTSMAPFAMCPDCLAEYEDPHNRRFHAQPNACPACGPWLWLEDTDGPQPGDPLQKAARMLAEGQILAIKGLGGFHLAVRADSQEAVVRLRDRKGREAKPLAVMTNCITECRLLSTVSVAEEALLTSPRAPLVLLERKADAPVCKAVAQHHRRLGVMLPYTPLHHLLFDALTAYGIGTLVMTSGNAGSEPICLDNQQALSELVGLADAWLLHNRGIIRRADDTVIQIISGDENPLLFRRSRGFAPVPVILSSTLSGPDMLAVGPELKNTICLLKNDRAFLSPHIGNLENLPTHDFFTETVATLTDILECHPRYIAHDMHPGYFSTQWAQRQAAQDTNLELIPVQHHHAHLAAVLAEHGHLGPAVGLILDGTGYGTDGTIWGGEILVGDTTQFHRAGHLETVPLPGGNAAIKQPWRTAVSFLRQAFGPDTGQWPKLPFLEKLPVAPVMEILTKDLNCPLTSSCGRLFDGIAAMTGRWDSIKYEAQAAIEFMNLTSNDEVAAIQPFPSEGESLTNDIIQITPLVRACALALVAGQSEAVVSARFHRTLIDLLTATVVRIAKKSAVKTVALGGGVLQNEILLAGLWQGLQEEGLQVLRPVALPPGDGAIALGQAVIARGRLA